MTSLPSRRNEASAALSGAAPAALRLRARQGRVNVGRRPPPDVERMRLGVGTEPHAGRGERLAGGEVDLHRLNVGVALDLAGYRRPGCRPRS